MLLATPDAPGVHCNRGDALMVLKRYDEAAEAFARVLALDAAWPYAPGKRLHAQAMACDWRGFDEALAAVEAGLAEGRRVVAALLSYEENAP